jgi:hypothetical protein
MSDDSKTRSLARRLELASTRCASAPRMEEPLERVERELLIAVTAIALAYSPAACSPSRRRRETNGLARCRTALSVPAGWCAGCASSWPDRRRGIDLRWTADAADVGESGTTTSAWRGAGEQRRHVVAASVDSTADGDI